MIFRYARHTTDLDRIEKFYTEIVGLEKIGEFKNHANYDGLFLGFYNQDWHLEFTVSEGKPASSFDNDDLLVFYLESEAEIDKIKKRIQRNKINLKTPKNPYWAKNGLMISDPDGFKIVFSTNAKRPLSK